MLRIASPTKNTAANNAASGKNLAITNPTPRNTEEITMAVRSVPTGALFLSRAHNDEIPLESWSAIHQAAQQKPRQRQEQGLKDASAYLV